MDCSKNTYIAGNRKTQFTVVRNPNLEEKVTCFRYSNGSDLYKMHSKSSPWTACKPALEGRVNNVQSTKVAK